MLAIHVRNNTGPNVIFLFGHFVSFRQQINSMVKKCADLMEAMYSPAPIEPEDDLSSFSRRSDEDMDIIFDSDINNSTSMNDVAPESEVNFLHKNFIKCHTYL